MDKAIKNAMRLDGYLNILRHRKVDLVSKGVQHIAIFGSAVRGRPRPSSDLDVLVTFRTSAFPDIFEFVQLARFLEEVLGRKVDLVERDSVIPPLQKRIVDDAVVAF